MKRPSAIKGFDRKVWLARSVSTIETLWPVWFPLVATCTLFLLFALFDLGSYLPLVLHTLMLAIFAGAAAAALVYGWRHSHFAPRRTGLQRLESDSGFSHQPLHAMEDSLPASVADATTRALWQRHQQRMLEKLGQLRLFAPRSLMPRIDPWALRALLGLFLIVGLVEAHGDIGPRIARAFIPTAEPPAPVPALVVELWVTPPDYTRKPPLSNEQTARNPVLDIPAGSQALLQLHHVPAAADGETSTMSVLLGGSPVDLEALGGTSYEARIEITSSAMLEVYDELADTAVRQWQLNTRADQPPVVKFVEQPLATARSGLELSYEAIDDYGVAEIALGFALSEEVAAPDIIELLAPAGAPARVATMSFLDLTAHPLAGLTVKMWMLARDQIGQEARSGAVEVTLPEREFTHPLAKAIIAERKKLAASPSQAPEVAEKLDELAQSDLATSFGAGVPLGLTTAGARLTQGIDELRSVIDLLWEIALFIEDGGLSLAERELRDLQERLQRALQEGADDEELRQLMDELQQALDDYLDEMMRQAMERMQNMTPEQREQMQPVDPSQMVDRQQLQEMLDQARELMEQGLRDQALEMMAQLQQMLENMQAGMMQQQQEPGPAEQAMEDLQKMIELQQNLLDRSFDMQNGANQMPQQGPQPGQQPGQQQGQQQGQQPGDGPGRAAGEQDALRRALGELMRRMGEMGMEIPRSLGQAELAMRSARDALQQAQPGDAIGPQTDALDQMQQGGQAMLEQLREMMAQQPGQGQLPARAERPGRDPLGRSMRNDGGFDSEGVEVPPQNDLGRARGVLEELHRRSRDRQRPVDELDYLDRLLDRF